MGRQVAKNPHAEEGEGYSPMPRRARSTLYVPEGMNKVEKIKIFFPHLRVGEGRGLTKPWRRARSTLYVARYIVSCLLHFGYEVYTLNLSRKQPLSSVWSPAGVSNH